MSSAATTMERPRRRRGARRLWTLRVLYADGEVCTQGPRPLPPGRTVLGREALEAWGLPMDPLVSREHLALDLAGGRLVATDLESRNGSRRAGRPLGRAELRSGDVLRLGDTLVLVREVASDLRPTPARGALAGLRGEAPVMHRLRRELSLLGPRPTTVLLHGESGVGKGVSARALHELSGRRGPLVAVNCAAIPEHLAESTLFGHERGAFTGADRPHAGYFREASGGTLFLDEVADLPAALQPKLLHAVEAGEVVPVGSARPVRVDLRILSATSLDLDEAVASGRFRGELHARLAEYVLRLPPLRDRVEDVLPLFREAAGKVLEPDLAEALLLHPWPFNVRELEKVAAEAAVRGADAPELLLEHLQGRLALPEGRAEGAPEGGAAAEPPVASGGPPDRETLTEALEATGGSVAEAARRLGRSRRQLYRDLARLEVDPADHRTD